MAIVRRYLGGSTPLRWEGCTLEPYGATTGGTRQVLIASGEPAPGFVLRYFELPPGTSSAPDRHAHEHVVYVVRGRATALLAGRRVALAPRDVVYIAPGEPHQFEALGDEPFGFLCVRPAPAPGGG